jgi:diacylglycerol kinase family enzyme
MYFYILDPRPLNADKFENTLTELQTLLGEFNIAGDSSRVTPLCTVSDLVETAVSRGATILVACGSDETFIIMVLALKGRSFSVAFIPLVPEQSQLATILGVTNLQSAVKAIAGRRTLMIDTALVGETEILTYLEFGVMSGGNPSGLLAGYRALSQEPKQYQIRIDNSYTMSLPCVGGMLVNMRGTTCGEDNLGQPTDGYLDLLLVEPVGAWDAFRYRSSIASGCLEQLPGTTVIRCKSVEFLSPEQEPLTVGGKAISKMPSTVTVQPSKLKLIVGKNRTF